MSTSHLSTRNRSRVKLFFTVSITLALLAIDLAGQQTRPFELTSDLAGRWQFALDPNDSGLNLKWFATALPNRTTLPGILQQTLGQRIDTKTQWIATLYDHFWYLRDDYKNYVEKNVKVPFLSQPPYHYVGIIWYQRDIDIPRNWSNRRAVLTLERPHWETSVWIDEKKMGSNRSLVAPHVYDLGTVQPGRHRLTIRVDNRMIMPYRPDAHSVSDALGGSWLGIVGKMELSTTGRVWIDDVQAFPDLSKHQMMIKVRVGNQTGLSGSGLLTATWPDIGYAPVGWDEQGGVAEIEVPLRMDVDTWDEFQPRLLPLKVTLRGNNNEFDSVDLKVGIRDFRTNKNEFYLNGRPIIFRGTHSGGDFPLTGYPPTDVTYWKKLFETCKKWGLNHMRFHSWCPPEAAFQAADEVGFYLQPEPGMWNEISPDTPMEQMLYEETDRMIKAYGNHPSFMLLSASNEPKGHWKEALAKWVDHYHKEDSRRLYANGTGHTEREIENITQGTDYLAIQRIGPKLLRRESGWFGGDYRESLEDVNIPVIAHEVGQWAAYPDYDIIKKFTGYMQPGNLEIFRDSMKAHNLLEKNQQFAKASGRFQLECYKEEIEANLRTPGLSGFQLLDLHDYLGQGTALVGLLDPFWEPKGYATPDEFKSFCITTVPLARLRKRVFTPNEPFDVDVEVAHYGAEPIENAKAVWRITNSPRDLQGEWDLRTIPIGKNITLGTLTADLQRLSLGEHRLTVTVAPSSFFGSIDRKINPGPGVERGVTYFENQWNFWIFPPANGSDADVNHHSSRPPFANDANSKLQKCPSNHPGNNLITQSWSEAEARLMAGGKVLFSPRNADLDWTSPPMDTIPIFWNRQMNPAWSRMLGLWIDLDPSKSKSAMVSGFPTDYYFDWQWSSIIAGVRAINLDRLPGELEPVVWAIDDWNRNYKLGVLFECAVGQGRLLVSAIDVTQSSDKDPVRVQLRRSLLDYMNTDCFQPNVSVSPVEMASLFFDTRIMSKLGASAQVNGEPAKMVIDGDPNTFVLVGDQHGPTHEQAEIAVTFPSPVPIFGVVVMGRQNHREHEGDIRDYAIQISDDGLQWSDVANGQLVSSYAPQQIRFSRTLTTRYLKLVSLSGFGTDKTTSLAELAVMYEGVKLDDKGKPIEYQRNRSASPDIDEGPGQAKASPSPSPSASPRKKPE